MKLEDKTESQKTGKKIIPIKFSSETMIIDSREVIFIGKAFFFLNKNLK